MGKKKFYLLTSKDHATINSMLESIGLVKIGEIYGAKGMTVKSYYALPLIEVTSMGMGIISGSDREIDGEISGLMRYNKISWPETSLTRLGISEGDLEKALKGDSKVLTMVQRVEPFAVYDASVKILRQDLLEKAMKYKVWESSLGNPS